MAPENPPWGAPRIHGEMMTLGIDVSRAAVANVAHVPEELRFEIAAIAFFTVPTATLEILCVFLVLSHDRRLGLAKDCSEPRSIEPPGAGKIVAPPMAGGLRHRYTRRAA